MNSQPTPHPTPNPETPQKSNERPLFRASPEYRAITTNLGSRLRTLRERQHVTARDVASRIGCAKSTIGSWERGDRAINVADLVTYTRALGVPHPGPLLSEPDQWEGWLAAAYPQVPPGSIIK